MRQPHQEPTRREFLQLGAAATLAAPFLMNSPVYAADTVESLPFITASEAVAALRDKQISSVELTELIYRRIDALNGPINAIVTQTRGTALKRAAEADAALANGQNWGPLHGLPITIKDTFEVNGVRSTAGAPFLSQYEGKRDAVGVARLKDAGAVILGKTNVPFMAGDVQSYNEIFGTTNNPWNTDLTSGGSTGGGAAALAAQLTYLSFGSDIGGSIRTPANFCGVFGHKPTLDLVPETGHIPPPPGMPSVSNGLSVAGPLGRSAEDVSMMLRVLGGPADEFAAAYRWEMPAPRKQSLKDYKVGFVLDDPFCPVVPETKAVLEEAVEALGASGAELVEGWPTGIDPKRQFEQYLYLLLTVLDVMATPDDLEESRSLAEEGDWVAQIRVRANEDPAKKFMMAMVAQKRTRLQWQQYFNDVDVFLSPVTFTPAFPHDHSPLWRRRLQTSLGERHYADLLGWIAAATYSGCPASSMPAGFTEDGLPVGLQIMGPFLEDATPLDLAARLSEVIGGYEPPPGY